MLPGAGHANERPTPARRGRGYTWRQPPLPLFVIGFLALVAMQSLGLLSDPMTEVIRSIEVAAFTIALVGVGGGVDISRLRSLGGRPLRLGLMAWVLVSAVALAAVALTA